MCSDALRWRIGCKLPAYSGNAFNAVTPNGNAVNWPNCNAVRQDGNAADLPIIIYAAHEHATVIAVDTPNLRIISFYLVGRNAFTGNAVNQLRNQQRKYWVAVTLLTRSTNTGNAVSHNDDSVSMCFSNNGLPAFLHSALLHHGILRIERFRTGCFRTIRLHDG